MITWLFVLSFTLYDNDIRVESLHNTICRVQDSVVKLGVVDTYSGWSGSGVLISSDGLILTARHVVMGADVNDIDITFRNGLQVEVIDVYWEDPNITDIVLV